MILGRSLTSLTATFFFRKSDFPKILKFFPNAEMKFIEGAGHWVHSEKPAEFLQLTLDFLNKKVVRH